MFRRNGNLSWCDTAQDLELVFTSAAGQADRYADLRRQLFSELHHNGRNPQWRKVGKPFSTAFAILAQSVIQRAQPTYILRTGEPGQHNLWQFTIVDSDGSSTYYVHAQHDPADHEMVHLTVPELSEGHVRHREAYEELGHGFRCLGFHPKLQL